MARARNIKPGFFTNDVLAEIDPLGRLLFAGIWTIADREGRLEDRPKRIKAELLPYDDCDPEELLKALNDNGFILRYQSGGVGYIQVLAWGKHQNPHVKEAASTIPAPCEHGTSTVQEQCEEQPLPERAGLIPDSLNLIPDSKEEQNPAAPSGAEPGKPARFDPLAIDLPDCIATEAWARWVAYRRTRKLTTAEPTVTAQAKKLAEWHKAGHDPTAIIDTSITSGWNGLFEPKDSRGNERYDDKLQRTADALTGRNRRPADGEAGRTLDGEARTLD